MIFKNVKLIYGQQNINSSSHGYPLKIPQVLQEFISSHQPITRHKRDLTSRSGKQLAPGVYSCGHQVRICKNIIKVFAY